MRKNSEVWERPVPVGQMTAPTESATRGASSSADWHPLCKRSQHSPLLWRLSMTQPAASFNGAALDEAVIPPKNRPSRRGQGSPVSRRDRGRLIRPAPWW